MLRQRINIFLATYLYYIVIFGTLKVLFMLITSTEGATLGDFVAVLWHGLKLDASMSGYLCVIPGFVLVASVWVRAATIAKVLSVYNIMIFSLIGIIGIVDIVLYPYWGFHFDSSIWIYLTNPTAAMASATLIEIVVGMIGVLAFVTAMWFGYKYLINKRIARLSPLQKRYPSAAVLFFMTIVLFLPIRGGVSESTMNVGKVYFSESVYLNHAAINPMFNLMASMIRGSDFGSQNQFFDKAQALELFSEMNSQSACDTIPRLLKTDRPNIILIVLESFSSNIVEPLGGEKGITPNLNRLAGEGVLFTNFYANSYRTDRGMVSIMSGYPAQPSASIMTYPEKTRRLPAIPKSLKESGYSLSFLYGGDIDFTNMRSYIVGACGISNIVSDSDFSRTERSAKWGVPDQILLERAFDNIVASSMKPEQPFFTAILTLSSHEPFDVPVKQFDQPFLNSAYYADSCIGKFVDRLKATPLWSNTLIVLVADHAMQSYPLGVPNKAKERFEIPMLWIGGAVAKPMVVADYGSQKDIAATLLSQLNIDHSQFEMSKDLMNPNGSRFAYYSFNNGFSMIDSTGYVLFDNDQKVVQSRSGDNTAELERRAKAYFQSMYIDLGKR